jgi:hypothetical protein
MARPRARSARDGAWSVAQVATAAAVSYQVVRTAVRRGQVDPAALTWHDVLVVRAVDELGGNPTAAWSGERAHPRAVARADRNLTVAVAVRDALRRLYGREMPSAENVTDLWLLVGVGPPEPLEDLHDITSKIARAQHATFILPLSKWVATLAAEFTDPRHATTSSPVSDTKDAVAAVEPRVERLSARPVTMTDLAELDATLRAAAQSVAQTMSRTPAQQIVHWARIGRRIEEDPRWSTRDVAALLDGRTRAVVERPGGDADG